MKPVAITTIETPKGKVELFISTAKQPTHSWQTSWPVPKMTWKLNGKRATQREAAEALAEKVGSKGEK